MDFVLFVLRGKNLHSGLNFEGNLYSDDTLQYCKGPIKYHWIEGSGPVISPSFDMALIFIEVFRPPPLKSVFCMMQF